MLLFGKKKKEETKAAGCEGNCTVESTGKEESRNREGGIKILGSGCAKCRALEAAAAEAMQELGMHEPIEHVTDFAQIASYGVLSTPALVVDGQVVSYGRVLKTKEAADILRKARGING